MTGLVPPGAGYARVCWGRWMVDCARPYCRSALTLGPDLVDERGQLLRRGLGWGQREMTCWDCDFVTGPIVWPPDPHAIELLLRRRPDIKTRSWEPDERLEDLLADNIAHGLLPLELDPDGPTVSVMQTIDQQIVGGLILNSLPDAERRRQITGGT